MEKGDWHWDHVSLDELTDSLSEVYPGSAEEVSNLVIALWARIIARRIGLEFRKPAPRSRRGY